MSSHARVGSDAIGGVILAGGLARRMQGRDKGLIRLSGKPLVQWVLEAVSPQLSEVLINANRNQSEYAQFGVPVAADLLRGHLGPLAGLFTGLKSMDHPLVFMCPCDSPFIPANMVERLCAALQHDAADIAVAHDGSRLQPVFCLVRAPMIASLTQFLEQGERKIDRWFASEKTVAVDFSDSTDAFLNINSERELLKVEEWVNKA